MIVSEYAYMARSQINVKLTDETAQRLREYTVRKKGSLRGQSDIVEAAVVEFLDRYEKGLGLGSHEDLLEVPIAA